MKNKLSINDNRVQECEPEATSEMDREKLPILRLRYMIDDYPEFKKATADSRAACNN